MAEFPPSLWFFWFVSLLSLGISFQSPLTPKNQRLSSIFSTTETTPMKPDTSDFPEYTDEQLHSALNSLLQGSTDPSFDGRHLFGFQDPNHKLSKLQTITATRILDYEAFLVRKTFSELVKCNIVVSFRQLVTHAVLCLLCTSM